VLIPRSSASRHQWHGLRVGLATLVGTALLVASCTGLSQAHEEGPGEKSPSGSPQAPQVITLVVSHGEVVDGPGVVAVGIGEQVTLEVTADVSDDVHVHGYDLVEQIRAGTPVVLTFRAEKPGQFDVELEGPHLLLVRLRVQ
jgi:hypothetical protein